MKPARRTVNGPSDFPALIAFLGDFPTPFTISVMKGKGRSLDQNALLHKWCGEIARQGEQDDMLGVKADCNIRWGIPILRRDDEAYDRWIDYLSLTHEQTVFAIRKGLLPCTRLMTKAQLSEYMNAMQAEYLQQGFKLTDPDLMEGAA